MPTHSLNEEENHIKNSVINLRARLSNNNGIIARRRGTLSISFVSANSNNYQVRGRRLDIPLISRRASPPLHMHLLGKSNGSIIVGQLAGSILDSRGKRDAVVDVEDTVCAARRPDNSSGLDGVGFGVDLAHEEVAAAAGSHFSGALFVLISKPYLMVRGLGWETYSLAGVLREVVGGNELACDALVETRPAVVCSIYDGVLETAGVLEVQVELASLGSVGLDGAGANVGLELVEAVGDDLGVVVNDQCC
jgi:hypothetical protein